MSVPGTVKILLCLAPTDMRKSIDGLAGLASKCSYSWASGATA
jgi:hypothetical protein